MLVLIASVDRYMREFHTDCKGTSPSFVLFPVRNMSVIYLFTSIDFDLATNSWTTLLKLLIAFSSGAEIEFLVSHPNLNAIRFHTENCTISEL